MGSSIDTDRDIMGENESNITPELIERLCFLLDSDSAKSEWERLNEIRGD